MRAFILILLGLGITSAARAEYSSWDHGRDCAEQLGVEVPRFNCLQGAAVPVTHNGVSVPIGQRPPGGNCDKSAFGSSGCTPGSRLLRFVDNITRNGQPERIVTTIICRKGTTDASPGDFHDIAVIQHNETNNKVCWYNVLGSRDSSNVPPPYTRSGNERTARAAGRGYWGGSPTTLNCISCHENGLYLRTPWIMQVDGSPNGAFERDGGQGPYKAGGLNGFPPNEQAGRRGFACTVGKEHFQQWNEMLRPGARGQIRLVKINGPALDEMWAAQGRPRREGSAATGTCTRCHFLGVGGSSTVCGMSRNSLDGSDNGGSDHAQRFPNSHWMPPADAREWEHHEAPGADATPREHRAAARRWSRDMSSAARAVEFCCEKANIDAEFNGQKLCTGSFAQSAQPQNPCTTPDSPRRTPSRMTRTHADFNPGSVP